MSNTKLISRGHIRVGLWQKKEMTQDQHKQTKKKSTCEKQTYCSCITNTSNTVDCADLKKKQKRKMTDKGTKQKDNIPTNTQMTWHENITPKTKYHILFSNQKV